MSSRNAKETENRTKRVNKHEIVKPNLQKDRTYRTEGQKDRRTELTNLQKPEGHVQIKMHTVSQKRIH